MDGSSTGYISSVQDKENINGGKGRLFGLLKKKDGEKGVVNTPTALPPQLPNTMTMRAISPQRPMPMDLNGVYSAPHQMHGMAVSPNQLRSSSPRPHSPASSFIFERNVQDSAVPDDLAPVIPAHMRTENHVPAVLEASSIAITDGHLKPDDVEIVTHVAHQPAAKSLGTHSGYNSGHVSPSQEATSPVYPTSMEASQMSGLNVDADNASTYGSIDPTDVRRLSFISFADVVQAEHAEYHGAGHRDSILHMALSDTLRRSPSPPIRSPASSHGGFVFGSGGTAPSPPTSGAPSVVGMDMSTKLQQMPSSPTSMEASSPPFGASHMGNGGELVVETMAQAMRRTGSGDLVPSIHIAGNH